MVGRRQFMIVYSDQGRSAPEGRKKTATRHNGNLK